METPQSLSQSLQSTSHLPLNVYRSITSNDSYTETPTLLSVGAGLLITAGAVALVWKKAITPILFGVSPYLLITAGVVALVWKKVITPILERVEESKKNESIPQEIEDVKDIEPKNNVKPKSTEPSTSEPQVEQVPQVDDVKNVEPKNNVEPEPKSIELSTPELQPEPEPTPQVDDVKDIEPKSVDSSTSDTLVSANLSSENSETVNEESSKENTEKITKTSDHYSTMKKWLPIVGCVVVGALGVAVLIKMHNMQQQIHGMQQQIHGVQRQIHGVQRQIHGVQRQYNAISIKNKNLVYKNFRLSALIETYKTKFTDLFTKQTATERLVINLKEQFSQFTDFIRLNYWNKRFNNAGLHINLLAKELNCDKSHTFTSLTTCLQQKGVPSKIIQRITCKNNSDLMICNYKPFTYSEISKNFPKTWLTEFNIEFGKVAEPLSSTLTCEINPLNLFLNQSVSSNDSTHCSSFSLKTLAHKET